MLGFLGSQKIDFLFPQSLVRASLWQQCPELAATVGTGEASGDRRHVLVRARKQPGRDWKLLPPKPP